MVHLTPWLVGVFNFDFFPPKQGLTMLLLLSWNFLCRPGWPGLRDQNTSISSSESHVSHCLASLLNFKLAVVWLCCSGPPHTSCQMCAQMNSRIFTGGGCNKKPVYFVQNLCTCLPVRGVVKVVVLLTPLLHHVWEITFVLCLTIYGSDFPV